MVLLACIAVPVLFILAFFSSDDDNRALFVFLGIMAAVWLAFPYIVRLLS